MSHLAYKRLALAGETLRTRQTAYPRTRRMTLTLFPGFL